jgi:hypothetical protein
MFYNRYDRFRHGYPGCGYGYPYGGYGYGYPYGGYGYGYPYYGYPYIGPRSDYYTPVPYVNPYLSPLPPAPPTPLQAAMALDYSY